MIIQVSIHTCAHAIMYFVHNIDPVLSKRPFSDKVLKIGEPNLIVTPPGNSHYVYRCSVWLVVGVIFKPITLCGIISNCFQNARLETDHA